MPLSFWIWNSYVYSKGHTRLNLEDDRGNKYKNKGLAVFQHIYICPFHCYFYYIVMVGCHPTMCSMSLLQRWSLKTILKEKKSPETYHRKPTTKSILAFLLFHKFHLIFKTFQIFQTSNLFIWRPFFPFLPFFCTCSPWRWIWKFGNLECWKLRVMPPARDDGGCRRKNFRRGLMCGAAIATVVMPRERSRVSR